MAKGGKRIGAGRPKGLKNRTTIERKIAEEEFKQRILSNIDPLLNSQLSVAKGNSYLVKVTTVKDGTKSRKESEVVIDQNIIKSYFDGSLEEDKDDEEYYYITTDKPDTRAIDSLVDRVFGKAKQSIDLSGNVTHNEPDLSNLTDEELVIYEELTNKATNTSREV